MEKHLLCMQKDQAQFSASAGEAEKAPCLELWRDATSQGWQYWAWGSMDSAGQLPMLGECLGKISYLKPDGVDNFTEHKQREYPKGTENGGEDKFQPRPDIIM